MSRSSELGKLGEEKAAEYLKDHGYSIIARNYRNRYGEIDLIALYGNTVVFVEVKTRSDRSWGNPEEAVTPQKQQKLKRLASDFLYRHWSDLPTPEVRFDVISLWGPPDKLQLEHFPYAF